MAQNDRKRVYSNYSEPEDPQSSQYLVRTNVRTRPYISNNIQGLTAKEIAARQLARVASSGGYGIPTSGGGYGGSFGGGGNTVMSEQGNFFSPQIGPDFAELPQTPEAKREAYRHFYNCDELVAQAIDLHTELPLSKARLSTPKPRTCPKGFPSPENYGKYILSRFQRMVDKIKLRQRLITMIHHYWLDGTCAVFAEDSEVRLPDDLGYDKTVVKQSFLHEDGTPEERDVFTLVARDTKEDEERAYYEKHYRGWERLIVLPISRVRVSAYSFTDSVQIELIPSARDRELVTRAQNGDEMAAKMVAEMPVEVRECIAEGSLIPMGTDPDEGSFVTLISGRKHADDELGQSILDRCLRTLYYREKLRQAQTSIASRAMTPKRIVWAEGLGADDIEDLRQQVDQALQDPDFSIVANYEIHWEEMGAKDRLLDLSAEYEQTERRLITGLGVTESLMSGESLYSGDRLKLHVINERYMHLREVVQDYVEESLFKPVARRMGFVEEDEWGQEVVLYPRLTFTRLPLRDSQDTFDALMNLYQKGSLSIDLILELLNIDPDDTRAKIEKDVLTTNDATFNEVLRSLYSEVGRELATRTDVVEKVAKYLGLKVTEQAPEENNRY